MLDQEMIGYWLLMLCDRDIRGDIYLQMNNTASLSTWIVENLVSSSNHVLCYIISDVAIYSKSIFHNNYSLMQSYQYLHIVVKCCTSVAGIVVAKQGT